MFPGALRAQSTEALALIALYNATDGNNWINHTNWNNGRDPCDAAAPWHGITCDGSRNITVIKLSYNGLNGSIPPELGNLTGLTTLDLTSNQLNGDIPTELGI